MRPGGPEDQIFAFRFQNEARNSDPTYSNLIPMSITVSIRRFVFHAKTPKTGARARPCLFERT